MLEKAIEHTGLTLSLIVAQMKSTKGDHSDPSYKILQKELIRFGLETDDDIEIPARSASLDDYRVSQADIDGISHNP